MRKLLCDLNICSDKDISIYFPETRDRKDVSVLRCKKSGVIFLSRTNHLTPYYYEKMDTKKYWGTSDRLEKVNSCLMDNARRCDQWKDVIKGKKWLDFGTGFGGILETELYKLADKTVALEPQFLARKALEEDNYTVVESTKELCGSFFEVVTMFHVLEHLIDPIETLKNIKRSMKNGSKIIIEVPHARDFLLSTLDLYSFKSFTFWSEHLILHTQESLKIFLEESGFKNIKIESCQRFGVRNHLHWIKNGYKPTHDTYYRPLFSEQDDDYVNMLKESNRTDTLIAIAEK